MGRDRRPALTEAASAGPEWVDRGAFAWLLGLGVLDPAPDPTLDAVANLASRWTAAPLEIFLSGEGLPARVAGAGEALEGGGAGQSAEREDVLVLGVQVGEVRGSDPRGTHLPTVAGVVSEVLEGRLERLRHDEHGEPVAVILVDPEGHFLWTSPEFEPLLGWPSEEVIGRSCLDLLAPGNVESSTSMFSKVIVSPGRGGYLGHHIITGSGESVSFEIQSDNLLEDERVQAIVLILRPAPQPESEGTVLGDQIWVLNRLSAGVPLPEVLTRVVEMTEHRDPDSHACIMRLSEDGMRLSPVLAPRLPGAVLGVLRDVPVGPTSPAGGATVHFGLPRFTSYLAPDEQWAEVLGPLESHGYHACWSLPVPAMEGAGQLGSLDVYRRVSGMPSEEQTRVLLLAARLTAIAFEHESKTRRLRFSATHDPLTGLANRMLFAESLDGIVDSSVGVLFIDLDRFKLVNDTLGHAFGDELLRAVAARLTDEVREPGVVARFGGDEFTILLPLATSLDEVVLTGERLLASVSRPYMVRDQSVTIGASAGATFTTDLPRSADSLVRDADTALYHAKERGRGRVEAFDARLLSALASRVEVERVLREALDRGALGVEFQPEVHIDSGLAIGAEALARCRTSSGQVVPPSTFIPVAEEVGLISQVFDVVLAQACRAALAWNVDRAEPLVVWVNLAPQQLGSALLVEQVARAVTEAGGSPETIGFEVTERGILPDPLEAARRLGELASLGVRLAVDDFGTGHSSLGYLQNLPVDTVKLDRSFVAGAVDDLRSRAIVRAVVDLATAIGLSCVAEGVETPRQLEVIRELGCQVAQGFVYSTPLPVEEVTAWMASRGG